jgi:crotonobetainyl-CoA:carnitine CoA-transferase CaiB-like acyl-CoA transferase
MLMSFGARVLKIEDPGIGDPMRILPPYVDGTGAGFNAYYAGAESVCIDLRVEAGAKALERLAAHADVLVESFRPGTLERWGIGSARLADVNPRLVVCSLSSFGSTGLRAREIGHDLNFVAESGLLALVGTDGVPRVQLADVTAGLLACSSILAALLERHETGRGCYLDQPLAAAPLAFLTLARAEADAGGGGASTGLLAGDAPAYRLYECAGGDRVALGALEPKFWAALVEGLGLQELAGSGLDTGEEGRDAARQIAARFRQKSRAHWIAWAAERGVPLTAVRTLDEAAADPFYGVPTAAMPAPRLGEHTARVLAEFGFSADEIASIGR